MTLLVLNTVLTAANEAIILGTTDSLLVGRVGLAVSTDGFPAVAGTGSQHWVRIEGTVAGYGGILLGDDGFFDADEKVLVAATGVVSGKGYGVYYLAYRSSVINYGLIEGNIGVYLHGIDSVTESRVENAGIIQGGNYGIASYCQERVTIVNTGMVSGLLASVSASDLNDNVRNLGQLFGDVDLSGGDDLFDGRGGTVEGFIRCGTGADTVRAGAGAETIEGGDDIDTLDFLVGGAIKVALDGSIANTRTATDDIYTGFENIIGSRHGNDVLTGNELANVLDGRGGNDVLSGGVGDDTLKGDSGADKLTGGLGSDSFQFGLASEGGDIVTDFRNGGGEDDVFAIDAAGFGGGLVVGVLQGWRFLTRADNLAQDGNDRFIFNTADRTLWFDVNGTGSGGLTLIADLQASAVVTAQDIVMF